MGWYENVAGPTLVFSLLSCVATGLALLIWLTTIARPNANAAAEKRGLREALVFNLMVAEFINSTNNSITGIKVIASHVPISTGPLCRINGWTGQVSVQAVDFSIFAIVLVTFLTFNYHSWPTKVSTATKFGVCLSLWVIPLTTGTIALAMDKMEPASKNWCWIATDPPYLRYVLGHVWRVTIFMFIFLIYIYIFTKVMLRIRSRNRTNNQSQARCQQRQARPAVQISTASPGIAAMEPAVLSEKDVIVAPFSPIETPSREEFAIRPSTQRQNPPSSAWGHARSGSIRSLRSLRSRHVDTELRHWLVLSVYPLIYMVLWIPGMAHRLVELGGGKSELLAVLQATTQLTGCLDALAFGCMELHGRVQRRKNLAGRGLNDDEQQPQQHQHHLRWKLKGYREVA